jgi:cell division protein FtsI (penicillin-binding protein 3)
MDVREVEERLSSRRHFEWLKRRVTPDEAKALRELDLPGIGLLQEPRRFYPNRELAGSVLGFSDMDGKGIAGIELALDTALRGDGATLPAVKDRRGKLLLGGAWGDADAVKGPTPGATVVLTIDRFIQFSAERALADAIKTYKAKGGMVIVMDPHSGEILALATSPVFDPNAPEGAAKNRVVSDVYEPGSVMKIFSIAAALDAGVIKPDDMIDVEGGSIMVGRRTITDTHKGLRLIPIGEIVKVSSNVGAIKIARRLGKERLSEGLRKLGFGSLTGVELPGERTGRVQPPRNGADSWLATASYGYGLTASPLQIASALSAIATDGELVAPTIVKRIIAPDGSIVEEHVPVHQRAISAGTAVALREMMASVFEKGGTAESVRAPGFRLAGKTGTAYKHDPITKRYSTDRYLSSLIGFAPADDPRLIIVVMIDEPDKAIHYGGQVAGPAFARIAEESLRYLGVAGDALPAPAVAAPVSAPAPAPLRLQLEEVPVPLDDEELATLEPDGAWLPPAGPGESIVLIPNFSGMSMGQAIATAQAAGVRLEVGGSGRAITQFPPPGRALKSITCRVTFDPG